MKKKNKSRNKPVPQSEAVSKVDKEAAELAEENGEAAEAAQVEAAQADKVQAAALAVTEEQDTVKAASEALKAAREAVKAAKAKVKELGRVPTCTSTAINVACLHLDCSTEDWKKYMAAAGYPELNKAAPAMLNQVRVVTKLLREFGHLAAKV